MKSIIVFGKKGLYMMFSLGSNYHALDTKLCALRATLIKDYESIIKKATTSLSEGSVAGVSPAERRGQGGRAPIKKGDLLTNRESPREITLECQKLCKYIYNQPVRDFVKKLVYGYANSDLTHYLSLWKRINKLDKPTQTSMRKIIGTEADMLNIIYIYRLKRYYHVRGETAYGYLLPIGYKLTTNEINRMLSAKKEHFLSELTNSFYNEIFQNMNFPEKNITHVMLQLYKKESRNSSIVALCSYLYEKHLEIRNIRAIYEGLNFKLPPNEILQSLLY